MKWWEDSKVVIFLAVLIVGAIVVCLLALTGKLPDLTSEALGEWGMGLVGFAVGLFSGAAGGFFGGRSASSSKTKILKRP